MKAFGVEYQAEKEGAACDRKNMEKGAALFESMVKADFCDGIEAAFPNDPFGKDSVFFAVEN